MRNLLRFLIKHHFILLFLILEIIAFVILINFNSFHSAKLFKVKHSIIGGISERFYRFSKYVSLTEENKELIQENTRLYNELLSAKYYLKDESYIDSISFQQYIHIPARVVNNSVNKQYNYITLNKGKMHGIKEDMGVVGPSGLVGIVTTVTSHFCSVIPILNRNFAPNARIRNTNFFGYISWPGKNYKEVNLKDIPLHATINVGDTIETSGYSATFPPGIMIGTITEYKIEKGVSYSVQIKLSTDFKRLTNVMVIYNILKEEQLKLEDSLAND